MQVSPYLGAIRIHSAAKIIQQSTLLPSGFPRQYVRMDFTSGSDSEESAFSARDWVQSLGWEDPLEKGMATHSSILAWRIPWTEEFGESHTVCGVAKLNMTE